METGREFLIAQLNNAIVQHRSLVDSLRQHAEQADDPRYQQLCLQALPKTERHQVMLEEYGKAMHADGAAGIKGALGAVFSKARDAVDAMRETDWLRVVGDIVMIRQSQDTFGTFARAGERLGESRLTELGRMGEQEHDELQQRFNAYAAELFVSHAQGMATDSGGARPRDTAARTAM
jgi:hypothetical protein